MTQNKQYIEQHKKYEKCDSLRRKAYNTTFWQLVVQIALTPYNLIHFALPCVFKQ
jgi:hypothetical protein